MNVWIVSRPAGVGEYVTKKKKISKSKAEFFGLQEGRERRF
jgi:hypothetical protein